MATLAFQTEEEEDEDMKMSHEKKLRVYICFLKYEGGSNFKRVIHLYIILSSKILTKNIILSKTYFHIS